MNRRACSRERLTPVIGLLMAAVMLCGCVTGNGQRKAADAATNRPGDADNWLIVDCLLPGQVRKLGRQITYLSPRRPIKTSASDCEIRGGEYVAYDRANYSTALKVWLPLAKEGDPEAQTYVGEIFERGLGNQPDYAAAATWYRRAADRGYSRAEINLGYLYEKGLGVTADLVTALNLYRRASGLDKVEVAFASSVEVSAQREEELKRLRTELQQQKEGAEELRRRLAETEDRLAKRQRSLDATTGDLRALQQELKERRQAASADVGSATSPALESKLVGVEERFRRQSAEMQRLQAAAREREETLRAQLTVARREELALQARLETRVQDIGSLQHSMQQAQRQLDEYRQQLADRDASLARQRQQLEKEQAELASKKTLAAHGTAEIADLGRRLAQREQEIDQQRQLIAKLRAEADQRLPLQTELRTARAEGEKLQQETAEQREAATALQTRLDDAQLHLAQAQHDLDEQRRALESTQASLRHDRDALVQERERATRNDEEIRKLKERVQEGETRISAQTATIARLEEESRQYSTQLRAALRTAQEQEQVFQREMAAQQRESESLKGQLETSQAQLNEVRSELVTRAAELDQERARFAEERQTLERKAQEAVDRSDTEIARLEQQLAAKEAELQRQKTEFAHLGAAAQAFREQLQRVESTPPEAATATGPTIEIIEPPLVATRGLPAVKMRSASDHREIIGRVVAPAGLLSLTINDQSTSADDHGLFQTEVAVQRAETNVRVAAVDRVGQRTAVEFLLIPNTLEPATTPTVATNNETPKATADFGRYYGLIIGNGRYQHLPQLDTARDDATAVDRLLRERYGFHTTLLLDADRYQILSKLNDLRERLTDQDNLLIYYAGHGELDRVNLRGYWLPVDAEPASSANWISNVAITDVLNAMSATHILVVADSCYSGSMTRSSLARLESGMSETARNKWLSIMTKTRSRTVLTSGGLEPVLDSGGAGHSVFAKAFLEILAANTGILEGQHLYREVSDRVQQVAARLSIEQVPEYAPIQHAGHESGEFFFVPRKGGPTAAVSGPLSEGWYFFPPAGRELLAESSLHNRGASVRSDGAPGAY